ncbi:hypothetical protein M153_211990001, partial [Pseudoloma neurophilia]
TEQCFRIIAFVKQQRQKKRVMGAKETINKSKLVNAIEATSDEKNDSKNYLIYQVSNLSAIKSPFFLRGCVNEKHVLFLIDTGADISVAPENSGFIIDEAQSMRTIIKSACGTQIKTPSRARLTKAKINGIEVEISPMIVAIPIDYIIIWVDII